MHGYGYFRKQFSAMQKDDQGRCIYVLCGWGFQCGQDLVSFSGSIFTRHKKFEAV